RLQGDWSSDVCSSDLVLTARDVRLITDPWLFGSAFNNGWDLISETKFSLDDFREITHIWFSHEHPDHFAPPVLKAIDPAVRANKIGRASCRERGETVV